VGRAGGKGRCRKIAEANDDPDPERVRVASDREDDIASERVPLHSGRLGMPVPAIPAFQGEQMVDFAEVITALMDCCCWLQRRDRIPAAPAGSFTIPAYAYGPRQPRTYRPGETYADAEPMVTWGGRYPVVVEYDIEFPVTADYTLHIYFAALQARPAELLFDGKSLGPCCRTAHRMNTSVIEQVDRSMPVATVEETTLAFRALDAPGWTRQWRPATLNSTRPLKFSSGSSRPAPMSLHASAITSW